MGLSHVIGDEVAGDGYPVCAIVTFALPVISNMGTVIAVMSDSAAVCVYDAGAHKSC